MASYRMRNKTIRELIIQKVYDNSDIGRKIILVLSVDKLVDFNFIKKSFYALQKK